MKSIKLIGIFLLISGLFFFTQIAAANDNKSLSTSRFIEVNYIDDIKGIVSTCSGKKAGFAENYVSIGIEKLTVNKNDPLLKRIFNKDRNAFGAYSLKAEYQSQSISISRVGNPIILTGKESSVDMGVQWGVLDRIPWVLKNATFNIKLGYAANSTVDALVEAFSGVTSIIPDYTISTSLATGFAITAAIDKLLFGPDRAKDLLNAERDLPLLAGQLCEGFYAIFAAENNSFYEKYYKTPVIWTGKDLEFHGKPINDVSYAVVSVKVTDRYYDSVESSVNDTSRAWSAKYRDIQTQLFDIIWASSEEQLDEIKKNIRKNFLEARTLLAADINLIQKEKIEIHKYALNDFQERINIAKLRIDSTGKITKESTKTALFSGINSSKISLEPTSSALGERLLINPENNIPAVNPTFSSKFKHTIEDTQKMLSFE